MGEFKALSAKGMRLRDRLAEQARATRGLPPPWPSIEQAAAQGESLAEIVGLRTATSHTFAMLDGEGRDTGLRRAMCRTKTVHWEPAGPGTGGWVAVDPALAATADGGYETIANRWTVKFAANHSAAWPVTLSRRGGFVLRWKVAGVGHVASSQARTLTILQVAQASAVSKAAGANEVEYNGVFTGCDLRYVVDHDYCKIKLTISQAAKAALRQAIADRGLDPEGWLAIGVKLDVSGLGDWALGLKDNEETEKGFKLKAPLSWAINGWRAKDYISRPSVTDEADSAAPARYRLIEHATLGKLLIVLVPLPWLAASVGAVEVDPDYYGDVADGYITGTSAVYATAHSTSTACDDTGTTAKVGQYGGAGAYSIYRSGLMFDASAIPDTATITDTDIFICADANYSTTDFDIMIRKVAWSGDFCDDQESNYDDALGGTYEATFRDTTLGWNSGTYYSRDINNGYVSKTGDTTCVLVSSLDDASTPPGPGVSEYVLWRTADYSGSDPYLTVTYTNILVKTVNGLARDSVKTINGLELASVKTVNGLSNQ